MNLIEARLYLRDDEEKWVPISVTTPLGDLAASLKNIFNVLNRPLWTNPTTGAIRLIDTLTTVSTVTTVTNTVPMVVSNAAGGAASTALSSWESMVIIPMRNCWANEVRANIL